MKICLSLGHTMIHVENLTALLLESYLSVRNFSWWFNDLFYQKCRAVVKE